MTGVQTCALPICFTLLDTQFVTGHLRQFGAHEVERAEFHELLETALQQDGDFFALERDPAPARIVEIIARARGRRD